jgi:hypothetical protein
MTLDFPFHYFSFHLEPQAPMHMPAYNKGNVIRGGFGNTFRRIVCHGNQQRRVRDSCSCSWAEPYGEGRYERQGSFGEDQQKPRYSGESLRLICGEEAGKDGARLRVRTSRSRGQGPFARQRRRFFPTASPGAFYRPCGSGPGRFGRFCVGI